MAPESAGRDDNDDDEAPRLLDGGLFAAEDEATAAARPTAEAPRSCAYLLPTAGEQL